MEDTKTDALFHNLSNSQLVTLDILFDSLDPYRLPAVDYYAFYDTMEKMELQLKEEMDKRGL